MTNQKSTTILIKDGLSKATESSVFPTFALKYFVPIYDYRTDTGVHSNIGDTAHPLTNAIPTSASVSSSAVLTSVLPADIEGDILWQNTNGTEDYRLHETGDIFYAAATETPNASKVLATTMSKAFDRITIVKENGNDYTPQKAFTKAWKGAGVISQTSTDGSWLATDGWTEVQNSTLISNTWVKDKLMNEIVYAGRNGSSGTYNITIPDSYGSNKINKVLIFIQRVNSNGTDYTTTPTPPVPFAMVNLKDPIHIYSATDTTNSNSVNGANFRVSIDFTASNTEVTYTPGDPFFNLAASPMTPTTQEPVSPIAFKGDVLLGPGDGGTAVGSPTAKLDLLRHDGKVLHLGTADITVDPGHFVKVGTDGIHIYDDAAQVAGSETSVWFSKTKPTTTLINSIGKFESAQGVNNVNYSLVNAIHTGTAVVTNIQHSVAVGSDHKIYSSSQAIAVGNAIEADSLKQSVIAAKNLNGSAISGSVITGERPDEFTTSANNVTGSFIHLGSIASSTNLSTVDRCILLGNQNTYVKLVNNSYVLGSGNYIATSGDVGGSFVHGSQNKVDTSNTYVMGNENKSYSSATHSTASQHIHINGFKNVIDYDSTRTGAELIENKYVNVLGDKNFVRNSQFTYILGGKEPGTAEITPTNNANSVQFSDRAYVIGNDNKIKNASSSFTVGVENDIDLNVDSRTLAPDVFQNNTLIGAFNKISAEGPGDPSAMNVTGSMFAGYENQMIAPTDYELNFAFTTQVGSYNKINVVADTGTEAIPNSTSVSIFGSYNEISHNQFNAITRLTMVGSQNELLQNQSTGTGSVATGSLTDVFIGGVRTSAYFESYASGADGALKQLNNVSMFGTLGYVDATYLNMPFKRYWDGTFATPTLASPPATPTDAYKAGEPRTVIMNGGSSTSTYGVGMAFGWTNIGTTDADLRQQIIIPMGRDTNATSSFPPADYTNTLNKDKPQFGIPTSAELTLLKGAGKYVARGTLCFSEVAGDTCNLMLWNPPSTVTVPNVNTADSVTGVTQSSALVSGEISPAGDGGATPSSYSFVYGTTTPPTTVEMATLTPSGPFTATLSGLDPNTTYYFRARATNSVGTGVGIVKQFLTDP